MSEPARNRFALDLDDLERQLRGAAQAPRPGHAADPLAELTRIVGQDDPLKDIFAPRAVQPAAPQPMQAWAEARQEPSFEPVPLRRAPVAETAPPPAELRGALDEFEALLRRNDAPRQGVPQQAMPVYAEQASQAPSRPVTARPAPEAARDLDEEAGHYDYAYDQQGVAQHGQPELADEDLPDLEPQRSRKGLWSAAALIAVGLIGVGAAMTFRSSGPGRDGQPVMINADGGPVKVEPVNPGGAEIPNQNKQIYERAGDSSASATPAKVVTREEQPIDVQQAARTMPARVVLQGPGSGTTTDANPLAAAPGVIAAGVNPAEPALTPVPPVPGLGEPRRVRTVSIRPDGTPLPTGSAQGDMSSLPSGMKAGVNGGQGPLSTASTNPSRQRPAATPEAPKVQERVAAPTATPMAAPVRVAAAAPAAAPTPAPATAALRAGTGDFTVQLGAPGSEAEARATFSALQRKYPDQLSGKAPIVRKTDLAGGKTVYRLRVGPYSREDASTLCTSLQSAGGQCFIAKN